MQITFQDIFNAAWQAFIVENNPPAVDAEGMCQYRTEDGRKCAVGLCIPDGHRLVSGACFGAFADLVAMDAISTDPLFSADIHETPRQVLDCFQYELHDGLQYKGEWRTGVEARKEAYITAAKHYGLKVPE